MARLAFLGTPDIAVPSLQALVEAGHDLALCVTRPDRKRGRGTALTSSPVKEAAQALGVPVSHSMDDLPGVGAELGVVVAYGRIIPTTILQALPMVNVHFSLLPRWRGAAPVERAILAGDEQTGVCLMNVEEGLDTGAVYATRTVPITDETHLSSLRAELANIGADVLVEHLTNGRAGLPEPQPQRGEPTLADKITNEDLHLRWEQPAQFLQRVVRLDRAWTSFRGKRLRVLDAATEHDNEQLASDDQSDPGELRGTVVTTGDGALRLIRVQPESRSPMSADEWIRGIRPREGERLGSG